MPGRKGKKGKNPISDTFTSKPKPKSSKIAIPIFQSHKALLLRGVDMNHTSLSLHVGTIPASRQFPGDAGGSELRDREARRRCRRRSRSRRPMGCAVTSRVIEDANLICWQDPSLRRRSPRALVPPSTPLPPALTRLMPRKRLGMALPGTPLSPSGEADASKTFDLPPATAWTPEDVPQLGDKQSG
ncbi:hypothetical protein NUU61_008603 [Penicillium alfredii]|uniref:Uncharacterized protein n=1 Tax=Penicillium alfredii TaxID=1506179 RepID=A0A9W9ELQ5_9EURO|nr:uncharacterized protein NUU61_008603 [Penicillium alfredii]KAJ5084024.1 hypothetical protein NUU61_008603 [Penicillium alfredii]